MASTYLTNSFIAARAAYMIENILAAKNCFYMGYNPEYDKKHNGYKAGDAITIAVPSQGTVRTTMTRSATDDIVGSRTLTVDKVAGSDFNITSLERTFKIAKFDELVLIPRCVKIANQIDSDAMAYALQNTADWTGTPGTAIGSFDAIAAASERLTEHGAAPSPDHAAMLNPRDRRGLASAIVGLNTASVNASVLRSGMVGTLDGVPTYMSQNVASFTTGARGGTPLVNGASQNVTYGSSNGYGITQPLILDGASNSITGWAKAGDVFTIAAVYDVNPVTKTALSNLKQFTVTADANSSGGGAVTLTITPAIIASGAFQNVSAAPADNAAITLAGSASTIYRPSLMMDKKAFALVVPPLAKSETATICEVKTYRGFSISLSGGFDVSTRDDQYRLDAIYGYKAIDPSRSVRMNG